MNIEVITPLHIGTGEELAFLDYISAKGTLVVADSEGLITSLSNHGKLEEFSNEITTSANVGSTNLKTLVKKHGLWNSADIAAIEAYQVKKAYTLNAEKKPSIRPFMRTAGHAPYVPGSSIKGAIRTAVIYKLVKDIKERNERFFYDEVVKNYIYALTKTRPNKMNRAGKFFESLLQDYTLSALNRCPNTDIMRAVHISDSTPLDRNSLHLFKVHILNKKDTFDELQEMAIHLECLPPNAKISFKCSIDKHILSEFEKTGKNVPFKSEKDLIDACKEFSQDIIAYERDYFGDIRNNSCQKVKDFYDSCDANIRIGLGSGIISNTIYLLMPEKERELLQKAYRRASRNIPTSRKVVMDKNTISSVLGWGRIS